MNKKLDTCVGNAYQENMQDKGCLNIKVEETFGYW